MVMIWTVMGGRRALASLHVAKIVNSLAADRSDSFIHDAVFPAERRLLPRGASLSTEAYAE
eukprot:1368915-Pleurochrysis_carterae.AAC.1